MKFESGKVTLSALLTATFIAGALVFSSNTTTSAVQNSVTICHATGSESNPWVEVTANYNAIYNENAGHFSEPGTPNEGHEDDYEGPCPVSSTTPTPTATASATPVVTSSPTPTATASATPVVTSSPTPTATPEQTDTPRETETPVSTPNGDVCSNIDGIQLSLPGSNWYFVGEGSTICREFEYGGPNGGSNSGGQVLGVSTGQVLGASTMAATGSFAETIYQAIMGLGGLITFKGIKKAKASKKN